MEEGKTAMNVEELAQRIVKLEDIEAIKKLKAQYAWHCDPTNDADALAALFTEDAVWDGGDFGRYEGRESIQQFFRDTPETLAFAKHFVMNPWIDVQGEVATGRWYLLEPCTFTNGNRPVWGAATYEDRYVKLQGDWKFQEVRLISTFWTPFERGWVAEPSITG